MGRICHWGRHVFFHSSLHNHSESEYISYLRHSHRTSKMCFNDNHITNESYAKPFIFVDGITITLPRMLFSPTLIQAGI